MATDNVGKVLPLKEHIVNELVNRCAITYDMGGDLKLLQKLSNDDRRKVLEQMVQKILALN